MIRRKRVVLLVVALATAAVAVGTLLNPVAVPGAPPTTTVVPAEAAPARPSSRVPRAERPQDAAPATDETVRPEKPAGSSVVVLVTGIEDGNPIAGVDVSLGLSIEPRPSHATTGADGTATFTNVPKGFVFARAILDGYIPCDGRDGYADTPTDAPIRLTLDRGVPVDCLVCDARDDSPIARAEIDVNPGGLRASYPWGRNASPYASLTTDASGRFRVRVPAKEELTFEARAPGFVTLELTTELPPGDPSRAPTVLRMQPAGTLRGIVRTPDGAVVAGASVAAHPAGQPHSSHDRDYEEARTDATGRYELGGLARGAVYELDVWADGWASPEQRTGVLVTDAAPAAVADFTMLRLGTLVIHVVDDQGAPLSAYGTLDEGRSIVELRDEPGVFREVITRPGRHRVAVNPERYPEQSQTVDVAEGATVELTIRAKLGAALAGTVVDDAGAPVPDAEVYAHRPWTPGGTAPNSFGMATTDERGRFRLDGLIAGPHDVTISVGPREAVHLHDVAAPAADARFVVHAFGGAKLRLVVPAGRSLPKKVTLDVDPPRQMSHTTSPGDDIEQLMEMQDGTALVTDGRVDVPGIEPGPCRIVVRSSTYLPARLRFDLKPGETVDLGDVKLDPGLELTGRVEDASGASVAGATVRTADEPSKQSREALTLPDGTFRLDCLPPGPAVLHVWAHGFASTDLRVDLMPGAGPVVVRLARGGLVRVSVEKPAGVPMPDARVQVRAVGVPAVDPAMPLARTDQFGATERRLPAGRYRVTIEGTDVAADVEVADGVDSSVRLVVR